MNYQPKPDFMRICRVCLYGKHEDVAAVPVLGELAVAVGTQEYSVKTDRLLLSIYECLPATAEWKDSSEQIVKLLNSIAPQLETSTTDATRPQMICGGCVEQLRQAHQFQQMCISADTKMQQMLLLYYAVADADADEDEVKSVFSSDEPELEDGDPLEAEQHTPNYLKMEWCDGEAMQRQALCVSVKTEAKVEENVQLQLDAKPIELDRIYDNAIKELDTFSGSQTKNSRSKPPHANSAFAALQIKDEAEIVANAASISCDSDNVLPNGPSKKLFLSAINPEGYKCDECPRRFAKQESLSTHKATTHIPNQYGCDLCAKKFMLKRTLAKHRRRTHAESKEAQKQKQRDEKEALMANRAATMTAAAAAAAADAPKLHVCKFCNKAFNQSCTLKGHLRIHTGEKPYLCSECGRGFNSSSNMKQHLLRHTGEKRYECPDCPKKFPCPSDLASHKAVHQKLKAHICDICGNAFGKPFQLKKHKMYHNGEKPHKCEYCEMRFVCADHMRRHMRTHTGEKPYKCKYCPRAFAQSNDLIKHLRSHLGENVYRCELCPCGFRLATELREHFAAHKSDDDATRLENLQRLMEEEAKLIIKIGGRGRGANNSGGAGGDREAPPQSTMVT